MGVAMREGVRVWMKMGRRVSPDTARHRRMSGESSKVGSFSFFVNVSFVNETCEDTVWITKYTAMSVT